MSWFTGCFSLTKKLPNLNPAQYEYKYTNMHLKLWSDRQSISIKETDKSLKALAGTVLRKKGNTWKIENTSYLDINERHNKDGHFAGLYFNENELELYNDRLGLRDIYYYVDGDIVYFSTRSDHLLDLRKENRIDWQIFGSYWLNNDPLGSKHIIKDISRLHQKGRLLAQAKNLHISNKLWTSDKEKKFNITKLDEIISDLEAVILASPEKERILALSGGADSRALLALLISSAADFKTVTWGKEIHPDIKIVKKICQTMNFRHQFIFRDFLNEEDSWKQFTAYVSRLQLVSPGTNIYELAHYREIGTDGIFLDGGAGSFFRRRLNVFLEYRGKEVIRHKNTEAYLKLSKQVKADVFQPEILRLMYKGLQEQADEALQKMPHLSEIGLGNWIDTWSMRYRTANISSCSQPLLDDLFTNYMPYLQPSVLQKVMQIPAKRRAANCIQKRIINLKAKELMKIPRIRYGLMMPYKTNRVMAKLRAKFSPSPPRFNFTTETFLNKHKERIISMAEKAKQKKKAVYSPEKISTLIDDYYIRKKGHSPLIWWLTFETYVNRFKIKE